MLMVGFMTRRGVVVHGRRRPRKTTPREDRSMRQMVMLLQDIPCHFTLKRCSNTFQHCFETSQQRIWTEVPHAGTKATPGTSDEGKYTGLCRRLCNWFLAKWKKVLFSEECSTHQFLPRHMHIRRPLGKRFDRQYVADTTKHWMSCRSAAGL